MAFVGSISILTQNERQSISGRRMLNSLLQLMGLFCYHVSSEIWLLAIKVNITTQKPEYWMAHSNFIVNNWSTSINLL